MKGKRVWVIVAVLTAAVLILGQSAKVKAVEEGDSLTTESIREKIYDSIPFSEMDEVLKDMREDPVDFSVQEYVDSVLDGRCELSLQGIQQYGIQAIGEQFEANRSTFFRLILFGILSGVFINFSSGLYEKQMGETGFQILYYLVIVTVVSGFSVVTEVAGQAMEQIVQFMNALIPSFSVALTWSSGSAVSLAFYETALVSIAVVENVFVHLFVPSVQVYFLISLMNPLVDGRFGRLASLIRGIIRTGIKVFMAILIGHQGIQGLIMPAMDGVKRSAVFRTAKSLPGVGNLFGGVTDLVIGTGVLIKSAIGVGGLVAVCILCVVPLAKLGVFAVIYRGLSAFLQPVTDRRMVSVFQSTAESGGLLFYIVSMTAVLFLVTLTIIIAATNRI